MFYPDVYGSSLMFSPDVWIIPNGWTCMDEQTKQDKDDQAATEFIKLKHWSTIVNNKFK